MFNMTIFLAASDPISLIRGDLVWFLGAGGGLTALIGMIVFFVSGHAGDTQGKTTGAWAMIGGAAIAVLGPILVNAVLTSPPGS